MDLKGISINTRNRVDSPQYRDYPSGRSEDDIRMDLKRNRCQYEELGLFGSG